MKFECKVIDDFIPLSQQEEIKNTLFDRNFPWYYSADVTFGPEHLLESQACPAFNHNFRAGFITNTPYYQQFTNLGHRGAEIAGFKYQDIINCRSFLQFPLSKEIYKAVDPLHVDTDCDHLVVLYYVCDSDGDTIIVDRKSEGTVRETRLEAKNYPTLWRVTPKQGRAVLFNGRYYHTAEQPTKSRRCVVNLNVI
jgi:hypothetical protein